MLYIMWEYATYFEYMLACKIIRLALWVFLKIKNELELVSEGSVSTCLAYLSIKEFGFCSHKVAFIYAWLSDKAESLHVT